MFFRIRPNAFLVAFWMGLGINVGDMLDMLSLQNRNKKPFYFWLLFIDLLMRFGRAGEVPRWPKTLSKTL